MGVGGAGHAALGHIAMSGARRTTTATGRSAATTAASFVPACAISSTPGMKGAGLEKWTIRKRSGFVTASCSTCTGMVEVLLPMIASGRAARASSGRISGSGFAIAKMMGAGAMSRTMSGRSAPAADRPRNTSAPTSASPSVRASVSTACADLNWSRSVRPL